MVETRLNLLKNSIASQSVIADAEILNKIPKDKMADFIEWSSNIILKETALEEKQWSEIAPKFDLKEATELYSAQRFANILLFAGSELTRAELELDLETLGFKRDKIEILVSTLQPVWVRIEPILKRRRLEAIPKLASLRWRVDVRYASSNYLKEPELVAILRIGTNDGEKRNHVHLEMSLDRLSWLESTIVKLKNEMLQAQQKTGAK